MEYNVLNDFFFSAKHLLIYQKIMKAGNPFLTLKILQLVRRIISENEKVRAFVMNTDCWLRILKIMSLSNLDINVRREGAMLLLDLSKGGFSSIEDINIVDFLFFKL